MIRDQVRNILDSNGIPYAVIGAVAIAARGAPRSTLDFDFLTTDERVLEAGLWNGLAAGIDISQGEEDDPLRGAVRISTPDEQIDVMVGRWRWEKKVIERADLTSIDGSSFRIATAGDLILLKLTAGGPIDQQDIIRLLAANDRQQLIHEVDQNVGELFGDAQKLWRKILTDSQQP